MSDRTHDAIVVGARCAGSPTAMLLARKGYRVLVVDRATFPSDTISTHLVHPPGVAALRRWGLLDRVVATGCPAVHTYVFHFGAFELIGAPGTAEEPVGYAPRRTVLDKILVDAAAESGAEVREAFTVDEVLFEDGRVSGIRGHEKGGRPVEERAHVVVGADGLRSAVAEAVGPEQYDEKTPLLAAYYSYWSDLPVDGRFQAWTLPYRGMAAWPTNDDCTLLIAGWPFAEFEERKRDIEGNYLSVVEMVPEFAERVRGARREERFLGMAVPGWFRRPYGPGWALVGDAGYNKDFITAQGISDAFRDAELCATALDAWLSGARPFDEAMADYQSTRDAHVLPMYGFTADLASLEPPPPELQQVLAAAAGNREAMDGFARVNAGVTSPAEYFSEENVAKILAAAGRRG
jgi:2-polyprenyl-6-methoxyphenol hydroxylase-like FAD-dependent oxidoreductase